MKIISGQSLDYILSRCTFGLNNYMSESNSARFTLTMEFDAPETLTGIGLSNLVKSQKWILGREIAYSSLGNYFEFYSNKDETLRFYIFTSDFIPILMYLSTKTEIFHFDSLIDTVGLNKNANIKSIYEEIRTKRLKEKGFDKLYLDEKGLPKQE